MNRRKALTLIVMGTAVELMGCGSAPSMRPSSTSPSVDIDLGRVGQLKYSARSPQKGNLYNIISANQLPGLVIGTRKYDKDRVTGNLLSGYAVVTVNGDWGPAMTNVLGERTNVGYVVGIRNKHGFFNSIMDVEVEKDDEVVFYYALPCSGNPTFC